LFLKKCYINIIDITFLKKLNFILLEEPLPVLFCVDYGIIARNILSGGKELDINRNSQSITCERFLQVYGKSISLPVGSGSEAFIHALSHLSVITHMPFLEIQSATKKYNLSSAYMYFLSQLLIQVLSSGGGLAEGLGRYQLHISKAEQH